MQSSSADDDPLLALYGSDAMTSLLCRMLFSAVDDQGKLNVDFYQALADCKAPCSGVPADQQLLMFAGRQLFPDTALLLEHLALETYSLAHEVCTRCCL